MRIKRIIFLIISLVVVYTKNSSGQVYSGGSYDGSSFAEYSDCSASALFSVMAGGSYDGSSAGVSACPASSYFSVVAGGSYDGSAVAIDACPASSYFSVTAGGFYDGSAAGISACPASSYFSVTAGGSYDGAAAGIISCASLRVASIASVGTGCGPCIGQASVTASGGNAPYTYNWSSGGGTNSVATGLCAGTYTVTVTDAASSISTASIAVTVLPSPSLITSVTHVSCNGGANGSASVTASGATSPYSYNWSNGGSASSISGLTAGSYSVTVSDANNCSTVAGVTVTEPLILVAAIATQTHVSCNAGSNGSATVSASGGTISYSYSWDTSPVQTTATAGNLPVGSYTVTVTDAQNCTALATVTITEPTVLSAPISSQTDVSCNGAGNGSITVNPSGGTIPYSYAWNTSPVQTVATAINLTPGTYTVTVTDANGCTASTPAIITEPLVLGASAGSNTPVCYGTNLNLTSVVSGGTASYTYLWNGPNGFSSSLGNATISAATTANAGTYLLTVTDANGCTATATTGVTVNICNTTLNLNVFIEGYYLGSGQMQPTVFNESVPTATGAETDTVFVELHDTGNPAIVMASSSAILMTDGTASVVFNGTTTGNTYWVAFKHRNVVETWSSSPVFFNPVTSYDFTLSAGQAYGSNMIQVDYSPDLWAVYNGDINQDQNVDLLDFPDMDFCINNGLFGYYNTDLNGDGNVDLLDFPVLDANINNGIYSFHP